MVSSTSSSAYPASARRRTGVRTHQPGEPGQRDQEPGRDRVELADVAEGERPQERPQRRRGVRTGEDPAHPAVPQQRHVIDRIRAGDHAADQRGDLQPGVRALVRRHASGAHRPGPAAPRTPPAPAPGPAPPTTPDSDRRRPPTSPAACERVCRVARAHCWARAPSEPDVRLSPHPAQASPVGVLSWSRWSRCRRCCSRCRQWVCMRRVV